MTVIRTLLSVGLLLLVATLGAVPAFAVLVTYSTTGSFTSCGVGYTCSGTTLTGPSGGGLTISFAGTLADPAGNVDVGQDLLHGRYLNYSEAPFGTFTVTGPNPNVVDTVAANFELKITQALPAAGGIETLEDVIGGKIRLAGSQAILTFTSESGTNGAGPCPGAACAELDPANGKAALRFVFLQPLPGRYNTMYWIDQSTNINPQTTGGTPGVTKIEGAIDATPEPTLYALTGAGFLGLLAMAIRRRRQQRA